MIVGGTVTGVAGSYGKPIGDTIADIGNGVENGANSLKKGAEDAGKGNLGRR